MQKITKILNILTIVMFVITVVLLGLFYFGGELPNSQYSNPVYTEQLIWWPWPESAAQRFLPLLPFPSPPGMSVPQEPDLQPLPPLSAFEPCLSPQQKNPDRKKR